MDKKKEARYLQTILKELDRSKTPLFFRRYVIFIVWVLSIVALGVLKRLFESGSLNFYWLAFVLTVFGTAIGVWVVNKASYDYWPVLRRYLDADAVRRRMNDIEV